jgi:hypothetical protein
MRVPFNDSPYRSAFSRIFEKISAVCGVLGEGVSFLLIHSEDGRQKAPGAPSMSVSV